MSDHKQNPAVHGGSIKVAKLTAQQGDICLRKLDAIPPGESKLLSRGRCVVGEGEATGHHHVVEESEAELIRIGERILLNLGRESTIVHPEHKPIRLSHGIWEVGRVREYDYFQQMTRQVID